MIFSNAADFGKYMANQFTGLDVSVYVSIEPDFGKALQESDKDYFIAILPVSGDYDLEGELEVETISYKILVSSKNLRHIDNDQVLFGILNLVESVRSIISAIKTVGNVRLVKNTGWKIENADNGIVYAELDIDVEMVRTKPNYYKEDIYGGEY